MVLDLPIANHGMVGAKLSLFNLDEVIDVVTSIAARAKSRPQDPGGLSLRRVLAIVRRRSRVPAISPG